MNRWFELKGEVFEGKLNGIQEDVHNSISGNWQKIILNTMKNF